MKRFYTFALISYPPVYFSVYFSVFSSNEELVRASDIVFIGLLPGPARNILPLMPFNENHLVISMMAAVDISELVELVSKGSNGCKRSQMDEMNQLDTPGGAQGGLDEVGEAKEGCEGIDQMSGEGTVRRADKGRVVRTVPLPSSSQRSGPILLHPRNEEAEGVLSVVGTPVVCLTEGAYVHFVSRCLFLRLKQEAKISF